MLSDTISTIFHGVWKLFLNTDVPGLDVSFAAFFIALFLIRFSIFLFHFVSGLGGMGASDYGRAANAVDRYKSKQDRINGLGYPYHRYK